MQNCLSNECLSGQAAAMAIPPWFFVTCFFLVSVSAVTHSNPADKLVDVLNSNRTTHKLLPLFDNPGLACLALQYIKAFQGKCDEVSDKKPADSEFAETFAPNCGVQASTLSQITGRLLGCQSDYMHAADAFSQLLIKNNKSLEILYNKNHTEVGAAVSSTDGGSPYFWCLLFSDGATNGSFVLEGGTAKTQRPGCFSGTNDTCSGAARLHGHWLPAGMAAAAVFIAASYAVGL